MKKFLSLLIVLSMVLSLVTLPTLAEGFNPYVDMATYYNFDNFFVEDDAWTREAGDLVYNGAASAIVGGVLTAGGVDFLIPAAGMSGGANDAALVSSDITIPVNDEKIKSIAVLGAGVSADAAFGTSEVAAVVLFSDNSTQEIKGVSLGGMLVSGGTAMGKALKRRSARNQKAGPSTSDAFIYNYSFDIDTDNRLKEISSITLKAHSANPYFVVAISKTAMTAAEIEEAENAAINANLANYIDKKISEITDADMLAEVQTLVAALNGKDAYAVQYAKLSALAEGAAIYLAKKPIYNAIEAVYAEFDYLAAGLSGLDLVASDLDSAAAARYDHATNLANLITKYGEAEALDLDRLAELVTEFGDTDAYIIDVAEKAVVSALKVSYEQEKERVTVEAMVNALDGLTIDTVDTRYTEIDAAAAAYAAAVGKGIVFDATIAQKLDALSALVAARQKRDAEEAINALDGLTMETVDSRISEIEAAIAAYDAAVAGGITFEAETVEKYNAVKALLEKKNIFDQYAATKPVKFIDISSLFNSDAIAAVGDATTSEKWYGPGSGYDTNLGFPKSLIDGKASGDIVTFIAKQPAQAALDAGYKTSDAAEFKIPAAGRVGGVLDSVYMADGKSVTIPLESTYTNSVEVAVTLPQHGTSTYTVNYADGGSPTVGNYSMRQSYHWLHGQNAEGATYYYSGISATGHFGWTSVISTTGRNYWPTLSGATDNGDGTFSLAGGSTGQNGAQTFGMFGLEIQTDKTRKVQSITFSGTAKVLFAVSQYTMSNTELKTLATGLYDSIDCDNVTEADLENIGVLLGYVEELDRRGVTHGFDRASIEKLGMYSITADMWRDDENTLLARVSFPIPVDEAKFAEIFTFKKNTHTTIENYDVAISDGGQTVTVALTDETRNGGNVYDLAIEGSLTINGSPITLTCSRSYTMPDFYTLSYDNENFNVTNNSRITQGYYAAATVLAADGQSIYGAADASGALNDSSEVTAGDLTARVSSAGAGANVVTVLWDNNMKTISADGDIATCTADVVAGSRYTEPSFDISTNTLKIAGVTPSAAKDKVVNARITDIDSSRVIYANTLKTRETGFFSFDVKLLDSVFTSAFRMKLELGGDDFASALNLGTFYFTTAAEKAALAAEINGGSVSGANDAEKAAKVKDTFGINNFAPANAVSDSDFLAAIYAGESIVVNTGGTQADLEASLAEVQLSLKKTAVLEAFNSGNTTAIQNALFGADGKLLHDDIVNFKATIDAGNVTLYDVYTKHISPAGLDEIKTKLLTDFDNNAATPNYANNAALMKELEKLIFVTTFNNPRTNGSAYIEALMTADNAEAARVASGSTKTSTAVASAISKFASYKYSELTDGSGDTLIDVLTAASAASFDAIIDLIENTEVSTGNGGGGGGGGGGTGGGTTGGNLGNQTSYPGLGNGAISIVDSNYTSPSTGNVDVAGRLFLDVPYEFWAYKHIESLARKDIISGKGERKFDPEADLTRGEFVKIICKAYGFKAKDRAPEETAVFADLDGKWYAEFALAAFDNGLVNGVSETEFGGDEPISRQDICTIIYRMKQAQVETDLDFADSDAIADYAGEAVTFMVQTGIINGFEDNTFRGGENCTRAQVAKIVDLVLNMQ